MRPGRWGGGGKSEALWDLALSGRGTGALTEGLPLELIEMQLKAAGVLLCGTGTGGNRLILTAHRCGLLPQVLEGTVCAIDWSCADQYV